MFETLTLTFNSTSNRQRVNLLPTSAKQRMTVTAFDRQNNFDLSQMLRIVAFPYIQVMLYSEAYQTMLASESILRKEWDTPEEDAAWANL
ncbi:MAG: hypothetical protein AUK02_00045 [Anaerolineae bacterium CG2_30_58_95]|nr:MAG: hypothetical protein AUK02_00045 [Anaerolineae bacterium CG2_30_58_95]PJH76054.1 MAG: hypothetical protein CO064_03345 [Anaerolineae bacterium CG_4_9_14_0_8_um_filter_58_9]